MYVCILSFLNLLKNKFTTFIPVFNVIILHIPPTLWTLWKIPIKRSKQGQTV